MTEMYVNPNALAIDEQVRLWREELSAKTPEEILVWAGATFGELVVFASSLGLEDQALTEMIARAAPGIRIFTLDTGRLFQETYDLIERTERRYGLRIEVYFPDHTDVEEMVREHGVNLFRESVELRKRCCGVRKVRPLARALAGKAAWITGLRSGQGVTRQSVDKIERDAANGLLKINPLADWTTGQVWAHIRKHEIPYNPLHDRGFPSLGCACCTRAIAPGEDERAGRWWWEHPERKECGLHRRV